MKPVLVGEYNPWGSDPYFALYPAPDGTAGHRLCCTILGMSRTTYLETFARVNLCIDRWSLRAARIRAMELADDDDNMLILLGAKVSAAFELPYRPFETFGEDILVLPHPSGLCRTWNEPDSITRARIAIRQFLPELADRIAGP